MFVSARASRHIVLERWVGAHGGPPSALMVGPLPLTPLSRAVIVDGGDHYETGRFSWRTPGAVSAVVRWPKRTDPAVEAARKVPAIRTMLGWSRFPYFEVAQVAGGDRVTFTDLRFGRLVGETTVIVPR